jgi:hypothetical protein
LHKFIVSAQKSVKDLNSEFKDVWTDPGIKIELEE